MGSLQWLPRVSVSAAVNLSLRVYILGPFLSSVLILPSHSKLPKIAYTISSVHKHHNSIISLTRTVFSVPTAAAFLGASRTYTSYCGQSDNSSGIPLGPTHTTPPSYQHYIFSIMSSNDMTPVPVHTEADFIEVKTGTNKCDFCEKNRCVGKGKPARHMRRCNKCSRHVCEPCAEKRGWEHSLYWVR